MILKNSIICESFIQNRCLDLYPMKQIVFVVFSFLSICSVAQEFKGVNFFNNLSFVNPSAPVGHTSLVQVNSNSFYSALPSGINSMNLLMNHQLRDDFSVSGFYAQSNFGKVQSRHSLQAAGSYQKQMLGYVMSFGLGFEYRLSRFDETRLATDLDEGLFEYGTEVFNQSSFRVPFGISLQGAKNELQAYYSQGIGVVSSGYGIMLGREVMRRKLNNFIAKDRVRLAFYHDHLNPKISFENRLEVENFGFQVFVNQNLSSQAIHLNTQIGVGVSYLWKVFDLNYSIASNSNGLGLNHQLGLMVFFER